MNKLSIKAFTFAAGLTWAIGILILAWVSASGWGIRDVSVISGIYLGYGPTFWGGIIGALWAFVDGCIGGFLLSLFYNWFCGKPKK